MDKDQVKLKLLQEQERWKKEQFAAGCANPPSLDVRSVGKLLRVIEAAKVDEDSKRYLLQHGIIMHEVGCNKERRMSSESAAEASVVTFSSSRLWLTGFLRLREDADSSHGLQLCDASSQLPSYLLDPSPQLVNHLVLVKKWVLVDTHFRGVRTNTSMLLEVHDEENVALLPSSDPYADWTQDQVQEVLEKNYPTKELPVYTGTRPWAAVSTKDGTDKVAECITTKGFDKQKKRRRVHAVFGCVSSVSPISWQKDRESSHFFVEMEQLSGCSGLTQRGVVSVMFAGVTNVRWHLFLRPQKIVLVTDLVKVYSRECEMFLLQATDGYVLENSPGSVSSVLTTAVLVLGTLPSPQSNIQSLIRTSHASFSRRVTSQYCGKLVDFKGRVGTLLWDECIELVGLDGTRALLCLFRFPMAHEFIRLREGTVVQVSDAHVLRWPTPVGGMLVVGMCSRSHLSTTSWCDPKNPCIVEGLKYRQGQTRRKWLDLGDFSRQSTTLTMWLLEILELLAAKFQFASDAPTQGGSSFMSFPHVRRRQAVAKVVEKLGILLDGGYKREAETLGATFLKCHAHGASNCGAVQLSPKEKTLVSRRVLTIHELKIFGRQRLEQLMRSNPDKPYSVQITCAADLDWCLLLGCIRGDMNRGNLEVCDRTGSLPLRVNCVDDTGEPVPSPTKHGFYLFRDFDLLIENYDEVSGLRDSEKVPLVYCVRCSLSSVGYLSLDDVEKEDVSPERAAGGKDRKLQAERLVHVSSLLCHQLHDSIDDSGDRASSILKVRSDLHQSHYISLVGLIVKKQYDWKLAKTKHQRKDSSQTATIGVKRSRGAPPTNPSRRLSCVLHVRDLQRPDTVEVRVDASRFGLLAAVQTNDVVEFTRLQGFVARSSFKVYLNWSEATTIRSAPNKTKLLVPADANLYGSMDTTFLNSLYNSSCVDRRLYRYVVEAVHINYVVLKRRCRACHEALQLDRRRGCWKHPETQGGAAFHRDCLWRQHLQLSDPAFKTRTRMSTTVRCIIDDGSGQAELFMEDDVAWELLTCTANQRRRFEEILSVYVDELSYFSGNGGGSFATSKAEREKQYYQNELRAFVFACLPSLRSLAVVAQRFYKASDQREGTSMLTFGKDIQIVTKTVPTVKLEAKRVDGLHVRSELQKSLARLRSRA